VSWAKDRQHDAEPAPGGGQSWATDRIKAGDKQCLANQALHSQAPNVIKQIQTEKYYTDAVGAPLAPELFVQKINVPVYLAGDWQDEQTGGYFANLLGKFTGTNQAWFTAQNGSHADPLDPTVLARWIQFLSIFVAQKIPKQTALTSLVASTVGNAAFGTTAPLPPDPFANAKTYAQARPHRASRPTTRRGPCPASPRLPGTSAPAARSMVPHRRPKPPTLTNTTLRINTTRRSPMRARARRGSSCPTSNGIRPRPGPRCRTRRRRS
jgi:hypothetical protein